MLLTVAYVRVSTDDQVEYSPDAQVSRCRQLAELQQLGPVTVIRDEGWSGKNLDRPGMRELVALVEAGDVANVVVWRQDRLSRSTGDTAQLMALLETHCVSLWSVNEGRIDLSTASGRMQVGVHSVFAQFFREQIVENVKMGMRQAAERGRWLNRPPTGYTLTDGLLEPNDMAPLVVRCFELRAEGLSYKAIEERTGVKYSTVRQIVHNRAYLGLVKLREEWFPGLHQPLVSEALFEAASRAGQGGRPGRKSRDLLSGLVRCGECGRVLGIEYNERAQGIYRCKHRGQGCDVLGRASNGLLRAALLGLRLLSDDPDLQAAIRSELAAQLAQEPAENTGAAAAAIRRKLEKLLDLHYADRIDAELFDAQHRALVAQLRSIEEGQAQAEAEAARREALAQQFEQVAELLRSADIGTIWDAATPSERRTLVTDLIEAVFVHREHLVVAVAGAPPLRVLPEEVGLRPSGTDICVSEGGLEPPRP